MLLTCPTCRSGLQVPDGTTAMVRCPACKTVFSPAAGLAPPEPEPDDEPKPKKTQKKQPEPTAEEASANRDFEPGYFDAPHKKKKKRLDDDDSLSPEERRALKNAFTRAAWGCKLIWISLTFFSLSMLMIIAFWFETALAEPMPVFITLAGVLGMIHWTTAAVGVGLCLSGPVAVGHWRYGIAAAVATAVHLVLLSALVSQGKEYSVGKEDTLDSSNANWGLVPTRLDAVTFYLTIIAYTDEEIIPKGEMRLSIATGVCELVRTALILMLLSSLCRAAGDEELSHQCTRAAGYASFGPGVMAICMFVFTAAMIETNAQSGTFAKILFTTVRMGTYAIFIGAVFPGLMAAREATDACEEPFQDRIPKL